MYLQKQKPVSELAKVNAPLVENLDSVSDHDSASGANTESENETNSESEFEQNSEYDSDSGAEVLENIEEGPEPCSTVSRSGRAIRLPARFRNK